jgi:hypothetical protein
MFRSVIVKKFEINNYFDEIGRDFCPFLLPSYHNKLMYCTEYNINNMTFPEQKRFVFASGLVHTVLFRKERMIEKSHKNKLLVCENIFFSTNNKVDGQELFAFPHWFLKLLFTKKSILFGKFWKGERAKSKNGRLIPIPSFHFLSIRSAIKPNDEHFFKLTPELTEFYMDSDDDNLSVFGFIENSRTKNIINMLENINISDVTESVIIKLIKSLMDSTIFVEISNWCSNIEKELGLQNYSNKQITL